MKVYITVIPEEKKKLKPGDTEAETKNIDAVMALGDVLFGHEVPTRIVITNMARERPEFRKASEL